MHNTVRYSQPTRKARRDAALRDCRQYLGTRRFTDVVHALRANIAASTSKAQALRSCYVALSFAGIRGRYPVTAMYAYAALGLPELQRR